ncbi:MAG TPA: glycosyltransferase [Gammaproteobacteria bacterium]|nr:glycosyltransferase [Gammaproteobacteria bacterium]
MKKLISIVLLSSALITITNMGWAQPIDDNNNIIQISNSQLEFKMDMRKLWEDHITYTRNYIISALGNMKDVGTIAKRLLKNQDDIGNAIKPYHGDAAGKKLSFLLRNHILIASQVVQAANDNNKELLTEEESKWKANADDIADFLSATNSDWDKKDMADMLYKHLALTTGEILSRLDMNWQEDVENYDKNHIHMLVFSDMLTDGIIKQFPEKFSK